MKRRLLIDQGNTRIKLAWDGPNGLEILSDTDPAQVLANDPAAKVWVSSVASSKASRNLVEGLSRIAGGQLVQVTVPAFTKHLPTHYEPTQLGVDRWLAALACWSESRQACLVVDAGTAITMDVVSPEGEHLGGYILPGLQLAQDVLLKGTAIPPASPTHKHQDHTFPGGTARAISEGAKLSVVSMIERLFRLGPKNMQVCIGGGDADALIPFLQIPHAKVGPLVLKGLSTLAGLEEN